MSNSSVATGPPVAPLGLAARFVGIVTAPKDTFQTVVVHPRWLGMLLVVTVIIAVCTALPMTTEAGKEATLRASVESMEGFGMTVSDQVYEQMRSRMWFAPYQTALDVLFISPVMTVI